MVLKLGAGHMVRGKPFCLEPLTKPLETKLGYVHDKGMRHRKEITAALWKRIKPLLPEHKLSPKGGRPRLDNELALNGIVFVLRTGIPWEDLPQELGYGSGMTCWRRLKQWQACGVWHRLHRVLLEELHDADCLDLSRASVDAASVSSPRGAYAPAQTLQIEASLAASGT